MQGGLIAVAVAPHAPRLSIEERVPAFQRGLVDGMKQIWPPAARAQPGKNRKQR
jgi:hypothetical protein